MIVFQTGFSFFVEILSPITIKPIIKSKKINDPTLNGAQKPLKRRSNPSAIETVLGMIIS